MSLSQRTYVYGDDRAFWFKITINVKDEKNINNNEYDIRYRVGYICAKE
jgi:hypothetical protein